MIEIKEYFSDIDSNNLITITSTAIVEYFRERGMEVTVKLIDRPEYAKTDIMIRPNILVKMEITNEVLEHSDHQDMIKHILKKGVRTLQDYYLKIFQLNNKRIVSSREIDNYCIIYNPEKINPDKVSSIVVALEL